MISVIHFKEAKVRKHLKGNLCSIHMTFPWGTGQGQDRDLADPEWAQRLNRGTLPITAEAPLGRDQEPPQQPPPRLRRTGQATREGPGSGARS